MACPDAGRTGDLRGGGPGSSCRRRAPALGADPSGAKDALGLHRQAHPAGAIAGATGCRGGRVVKLYTYFRSSAAYRVRIALNLKRVSYEAVPVNLLKGEQREAGYKILNPQMRVPSLDIGE